MPTPFGKPTPTFVAIALLGIAGGVSADMPQRRSGLWEIKTSHDGSASDMTLQICVDEKQDDFTVQQTQKLDQDVRKQCPKMDVKRRGNVTEIDSVCKFGQVTATGHTVISGNLATQYRMEATTLFNPPMYGMVKTNTVMHGKWLGPCKPGQTHGSMTFSGPPGGGVGKIDPEMLQQLQKMQQQTPPPTSRRP